MAKPLEPGARATAASRSLAWPIVLIFAIGIGYGLIFSLNRIATLDGIPFLAYVFWQSLGAGLIMLAIAVFRRRRIPLDRPHLRIYLLSGILGMGAPYALLAFVAPKLPAGVVALGFGIGPILTYGFAVLFKLHRLRWIKSAGMALGLVGVLLVVVPENSLPAPGMVGWVLIGLSPAVLLALQAVCIERFWPERTDSLTLSVGFLFVSALFVLPFLALRGDWWFFEGPMGEGDWALLGVTLLVAFDAICLFEIIRRIRAVAFSSVAYLDILAGIGWGMLIFGERHSGWIWGALVCLLAGLFLVARPERGAQTQTK